MKTSARRSGRLAVTPRHRLANLALELSAGISTTSRACVELDYKLDADLLTEVRGDGGGGGCAGKIGKGKRRKAGEDDDVSPSQR